jgi:hypothetical protein
VLQDYDIVSKLRAVVADNSGTNDTLCQEIEAYLLNTENLVWESSQWQLCCLGHIINLAVQAFLFHNVVEMEEMELYDESEKSEELRDEMKQKFWLLGPLGKLHNIIVNIHSSASHTAEFLKLAPRMIPLDNHTQWNSWYLLLIVADKHALSIDIYTKSHFAELSEDYLTLQDWMRLCMIMIFLQPFHQATLETQEHCAILEKVLFTMDILVQYFKTALVSKYKLSSFKEIL